MTGEEVGRELRQLPAGRRALRGDGRRPRGSDPLKTARALAAALGVTPPRVSQLRRYDWFPRGPPWLLEDVLAAIREHAPKTPTKINADRGPAAQASEGHLQGPVAPAGPRSDVEILLDGAADAREWARASVRIAARQLARGEQEGVVKAKDLAGVKAALEELRRTEAGFLALERERAELVARDVAAAAAGEIAAHFVRALDAFAGRVAALAEQWVHDEAFRARSAADRALVVRQAVEAEARAIRELGAAELERLLTEGV